MTHSVRQHIREHVTSAFEEAFAALRLKGIEPSGFMKDQARRIIDGELSIDQAREELVIRTRSLREALNTKKLRAV
jgi:hypothetical protein